VRLVRIHLEEDPGKLVHAPGGTSFIDYNRSGIPLVEIVSEPDLRSADEAAEYVRAIRTLVRYLGIGDGNMEEGSLRCDANVSLRPVGASALGTKAEIKNMNSFKNVRDAIEHEVKRQAALLDRGERVVQETRRWDAARGVTHAMRSKEQAHDYRYFPEPDLLPLVVDAAWKAEIEKQLPELPETRRARMVKEYGITEYDANVLTFSKQLADQFEAAAKAAKNPKRVANLVQGELMGRLKAKGLEIGHSPITMQGVAMSADLVESGAISGKMLKDFYDLSFERGKDFGAVYEEEGRPVQSSDTSALEKIIDELIAANPKQVEQYRAGKKTMIGFFVGQVMKASKGQANPQVVNEVLVRKLEG